jgi:hypothetical protein
VSISRLRSPTDSQLHSSPSCVKRFAQNKEPPKTRSTPKQGAPSGEDSRSAQSTGTQSSWPLPCAAPPSPPPTTPPPPAATHKQQQQHTSHFAPRTLAEATAVSRVQGCCLPKVGCKPSRLQLEQHTAAATTACSRLQAAWPGCSAFALTLAACIDARKAAPRPELTTTSSSSLAGTRVMVSLPDSCGRRAVGRGQVTGTLLRSLHTTSAVARHRPTTLCCDPRWRGLHWEGRHARVTSAARAERYVRTSFGFDQQAGCMGQRSAAAAHLPAVEAVQDRDARLRGDVHLGKGAGLAVVQDLGGREPHGQQGG